MQDKIGSREILDSLLIQSREFEHKINKLILDSENIDNVYMGISSLKGSKIQPKNSFLRIKNLSNSLFTKINAIVYDSNITATLTRIIEKNDSVLNTLHDLVFIIINGLQYLKDIDNYKENIQSIVKKSTEEQLDSEIKRLLIAYDELTSLLNHALQLANEIHKVINDELNEVEYLKRFREETDLLTKEYENKIINLTQKFENKIKNFELDREKASKSSTLLVSEVDAGLKKLIDVNDRVQKLELTLTNAIKNAEEKATIEFAATKERFLDNLNNVIVSVNQKLDEIDTLHADFKNVVEKAGIYDLIVNYKDKAEEEKTEYQDYRKYTTWSIIAAIISTIVIFAISLSEHIGSDSPQINYLLLVSRLSISVMFFVLAFYLSKQAAKHYECYQENHRTFLQLAALEPFMARMTDDEKKEIRKGLIPSYFNQGADDKFAAKGDEVSTLQALITPLSEIAASLKKPSKESDPS